MTLSEAMRLALRGLRREWRSGESLLMALALTLAVAAMTGVGVVAQRVDDSLQARAGQLLGADLVFSSERPLPAELRAAAQAASLATTSVAAFPSMVTAGTASQLCEVRSVDGRFPLRGEGASGRGAADSSAPPAAGTVAIERTLAVQLGLSSGDIVQLGYSRLRVGAILEARGDAALEVFNVAPRLVMNQSDLQATGLIAPGSRVRYRLLVAGEPERIASYRSRVEATLPAGVRVQGLQDARPEIRNTLQRARQFLGLAGMASVVLAAVALLLAVQRYVGRRVDEAALLRCWGVPFRRTVTLHLLRLLMLGGLAALAGVALGLALQSLLALQLAALVGEDLPPLRWTAPVLAAANGLVVLMATAVPPLLRLQQVSPLRVLRDDLPPLRGLGWGAVVLLTLALAGLLIVQAGDWRLGLFTLGGFAAALVTAAVLGASVLWGLQRWRRSASSAAGTGWRLGLAAILRHRRRSLLQLAALAVGIMALLLLTLVRSDLIAAWQASVPSDAPNRFVINLRPDQVPQLSALFAAHRLPSPRAYPMVRGRLLAIDGRSVDPAAYADENTRRLVEREFNLSFESHLAHADNRIVAGRWWREDELDQPLVSVEAGVASKLGIDVGSHLQWALGGRDVSVQVQSIREVDWDSFGVNFFVVATPAVLAGEPSTWITSFHLPADRGALERDLLQAVPNATVLNVGELLERIRSLIDRLSAAVATLAWLTMAAGTLVVGATLLLSQDDRLREAGILRTLGASRAQLRGALLTELALIGGLAGTIASACATLAGVVLASRVLDVPYHPGASSVLAGPLLGIGLAVVSGWLVAGRGVSRPPLALIRQS